MSIRKAFVRLFGALIFFAPTVIGPVLAPAASAVTPSESVQLAVHVVAAGDTLTSIAQRYQTTIPALVKANSLRRQDHIVIGQQLKVMMPASWAHVPARLRAHPSRLALLPSFEKWADLNDVPADLLKATTYLESGWDNSRVSSTGAVGIGQLMPDTAAFIQRELIGSRLDPTTPDDNIRMSARYLRFLLKGAKGDTKLALMRYYQGIGSLQKNGAYPQTKRYAADVMALRKHFVASKS